MAISVAWYGLGLQKVAEQSCDWEGSVLMKLALVLDTYTPNIDTHDFRDDFTAFELSNALGYTTGGVTLTNPLISYDATSHQVRFDCDDVAFPFSGSRTWRYGIVYENTAGADSTDPLLGLLTWDVNQTVSTPYTLTIDPAGLLYLDVL
jgi:hypothetical protein